jgi:integrase
MEKEQYSEEDWLDDLYNSSESSRTVKVARTSLKTFDFFCQSQGLSREGMIKKYQNWFKPEKIDGDRPDADIESVCLSLSKFNKFMNEVHEDIITNVPKRGESPTLRKKSPKTIRLYFGFVKSYLRKCHGVRLTIDDVKDYVTFPKNRKDQRQPITLEQLKQIMSNATPKRRAMYYVLVSSGMRIGEAVTLTRKNFHFDQKPVRVNLEADNTKTKESRETFISSETVEKLKHVLGDCMNHKESCDCTECTKQFFAWGDDQATNVSYEDQYFASLRTRIGTKLGHKQADSLKKTNGEGFFKKYPNSVRYVCNIHSMRSYFITKASLTHGSDYGHALSGHGSYLKEYIRIPEEQKQKMYLELEHELLIESVKVESKDKEKKIVALESIVEQLQDKMLRIELLNQ